MHHGRMLLWLFVSIAPACKTVSESDPNGWEFDGNQQRARQFVLATVERYYKDVDLKSEAVQRFASALLDQKTSQTESAQYVLETYWRQSRGLTLTAGQATPVETYIAQEFLVLTNYLAVQSRESSQLEFIGSSN